MAGWIAFVLVLWAVAFGAAIFGVPTVYSWWKQSECWLRGPDSHACWEVDLLERPERGPADRAYDSAVTRGKRPGD